MPEVISKEEFNELINLKGELRGGGIKAYGDFILKEKGEEGLKKLEETIAKLGFPIKFRELRTMEFFPVGLEAIILLAIQRLFDYDDKKFQEIGGFEPKSSLILRLFMKYFASIDMVAKQTPSLWKEHFTFGDCKVIELNKEKRYIVLRIENFRLHPLHCQNLIGYLSTVVQMVTKSQTTCQETKCVFRGDEYHEFLLKW